MNPTAQKIPDENNNTADDIIRKISSGTDNYEIITLDELKRSDASLMSRRESKYLMTFEKCLEIISALSGDYRLLDVEGCTVSGYETVYYDDNSFITYHQHHSGKLNRYKLRTRRYLSSGESYVEIKEKKNTGVTIKKRIETSESGILPKEEQDLFLKSNFPYDYHDFHPVLTTEYSRVTFVSKNYDERITFDFGLTFSNSDDEISLPEVVIAEVKSSRNASYSKALSVMQAFGIRKRSFSKYCIGVSLIYKHLKHNRFKPNLMYLSRISGGEALCC
ncbi:polyphosphate polymerase domain-containing protein [Methanoplanus limicola]|uniref:VTC domain-containing protein n=1 Tax=Methanoplanus limicola DSM 2279 TaxID=937775 RepID=H1Z3T7_9EURY|nr:polyphosphate polymerase domain-containing protein [Methanoplanus limicola]EHQ36559.1 VTC domain-containing protein [Methanoplanus limicola DSM 2279]